MPGMYAWQIKFTIKRQLNVHVPRIGPFHVLALATGFNSFHQLRVIGLQQLSPKSSINICTNCMDPVLWR